MPAQIQTIIDSFHQQSRMRAGSLIFSVFGDAVYPRGGRIWMGSLIGLLQPLGINERLIRTSVFRLAQDGWLRTEAHGRRADYILTPNGQERLEDAASQIYAAAAPQWDRRWRLILLLGNPPARQRERLRRALFWQGFGLLGSDCFIHPSVDMDAASDALFAEGLGDMLPMLMPLLAVEHHFDSSAQGQQRVLDAWDLGELGQAYAAFVQRYQGALNALRQMPPEHPLEDGQAFLLRILLVHEYRRLLLRDPQLPAELLPLDWPGHEARAVSRMLYRRLLAPSERHLDTHFQLADGSVPAANHALLQQRFEQQDPLALLPGFEP